MSLKSALILNSDADICGIAIIERKKVNHL